MADLPEEAVVRAYLAGSLVYVALRHQLRRLRLPETLASFFPLFDVVAVAAVPSRGGFRLVGRATLVPGEAPPSIAPRLLGAVPAGASLLVATSQLDRPLRRILAGLDRLSPRLHRQLRLAQAALGLSLEGDILPALSGEAALVLYPQGTGLVVLVDRSGEGVLRRLLARLRPILALANLGSLSSSPGGALRLFLPGPELTLFLALERGRLLVATSARVLARMRAKEVPLGSNPDFRALLGKARLPSRLSALVYLGRSRVAALVGLRPDGAELEVEGFLSLK